MEKNFEKTSKTNSLKNKNTIAIIVCVALVLVVVSVFFAIKTWVISNYKVQMSSMEPTYTENDVVWASKLKTPRYGDVVLVSVENDGSTENYIKRAVGFGGDLLWVEASPTESGEYYLCRIKNGSTEIERLVQETYGGVTLDNMYLLNLPRNEDGFFAIGIENALTVEENSMYCIGDNRNNSMDSRTLGSFAMDSLIGVVVGDGMGVFWLIAISFAVVVFVGTFFLFRAIDKKTESEKTCEILLDEEEG